jgi:hypothetical protein
MQASYRLWHTRCVPQCARACEQVARSWAAASFRNIATNGTPSTATRTVPNSKRAITSPHKWRRGPNLIFEKRPPRNSKGGLETALPGRIHREQTSRWVRASFPIWRRSDLILAEMSHLIGFRLEAVARRAHAALRCSITISQNRGNASAREPRTCHGRGFLFLTPDSRQVWAE